MKKMMEQMMAMQNATQSTEVVQETTITAPKKVGRPPKKTS